MTQNYHVNFYCFRAGDAVGTFAQDKLGTGVHAPFDGKVTKVTDHYVVIRTNA